MLDGQKKLHKNDGITRPGTRQPRKTRKSVTHGNRKNRHGYGKIKTAMRIYPDMESPPVRDMNDVKLAVVDFGDADGKPLWPHRHHQRCHTYYIYVIRKTCYVEERPDTTRTNALRRRRKPELDIPAAAEAAVSPPEGRRGIYMRPGRIMGIMRMAGARPGPGRWLSLSPRSPPLTPLNMFRR